MAIPGFKLLSRNYQQIPTQASQAAVPVPNVPGAEVSATLAALTAQTSDRIRASAAQNIQTAAAGYNSLANAAGYSGATDVSRSNIGQNLASLGVGLAETFMQIQQRRKAEQLEQFKVDYLQAAQGLASDASGAITGEGGTIQYRNSMQELVNQYQSLGLDSETLATGMTIMFGEQRKVQAELDKNTLDNMRKLAESTRAREIEERRGKYASLIGSLSAGVSMQQQNEAAAAIYGALSQDMQSLDALTFNELSTSVLTMLNDGLYAGSKEAQTIARNVQTLQQAHNYDIQAYSEYLATGDAGAYYAKQSQILASLPPDVRSIFEQNTAMQAAASDLSRAQQMLSMQNMVQDFSQQELSMLDLSRGAIEGQAMGALIQYFYDNPGQLEGLRQAYGGTLPPSLTTVASAVESYSSFVTADKSRLVDTIAETRAAIHELRKLETITEYDFLVRLTAGAEGMLDSALLRDAVPQMLLGIPLDKPVITEAEKVMYLTMFKDAVADKRNELERNVLPRAIAEYNAQASRWANYGLFAQDANGNFVQQRLDSASALETIQSLHSKIQQYRNTARSANLGLPPNFRMPQLYSERTAEGVERIFPFLPNANPVITSEFGATEPFRNGVPHRGLDFGVEVGTPIVALSAGEVIFAAPNRDRAGTMVIYRSDDGYEHEFLHLDSYTVQVGQRVMPGDIIAYSGNTGDSTGPHLDWRVKDPSGKWIDPLSYSQRVPQKLRQLRGANTPNVVRGVVPTQPEGVVPRGGLVGQAERVIADGPGAREMVRAAHVLKLDPTEFVALMSFESAGTLNPNVIGGDNNNYQGLIQFSPENRSKYGITPNQSISQQMPAIVQYLIDRGFKPGEHDIRHAYSAILTGQADESYWNAADSNGTTVNNAYNLFKSGDHYSRAKQFLTDSQASLVMSAGNAVANVAHGAQSPLAYNYANPVRLDFASNNKGDYSSDASMNFGYAALTDNSLRKALHDTAKAVDIPAQWLADTIALYGSWQPDGVNQRTGGLGLTPFNESELPVDKLDWYKQTPAQQLSYLKSYIESAIAEVGGISTPTELVVLFELGAGGLAAYKGGQSLPSSLYDTLLSLGIHAGRQYRTPATGRSLVTHSRFTQGCAVCENMRYGNFFTPHEGFL